MNGVNKVFIIGRLGQDPKEYTTKEGKPYTRLNLATNYMSKKGDGTNEQKTQWHSVFVFGKKAEICRQFLEKGAPVCVEGHLSTYESTDMEGKKSYNTSITAHEVTFLPH